MSLPRCDSIRCACAQEQFALYCCASASLLKCVLKLQRINRTIVVVARIPDFAAYITDGGQDWAAAVVSVDIIIIEALGWENSKRLRAEAIFDASHMVRVMWTGANKCGGQN